MKLAPLLPSPPGAGSVRRTLGFARLLLWRAGRDRPRVLLFAPLAVAVVIAFIAVSLFAWAPAVPGNAPGAFDAMAPRAVRGLLEAFLARHAPSLLATMSGVVAAWLARATILADAAGGALEVLLASAHDAAELASAYLLALAALTLATLAGATLAAVAVAAFPGTGVDLAALLREARAAAPAALLPGAAVVSVEIALAASLSLPKRFGAPGPLAACALPLVAALPGLGALLIDVGDASCAPGSAVFIPGAIGLCGVLHALAIRRLSGRGLHLAS